MVRDPLINMSFLNRKKNFLLDNSLPKMPCNELIMDNKIFQRENTTFGHGLRLYEILKIANSNKVIKNIIFHRRFRFTKKLASLFNKLNIIR